MGWAESLGIRGIKLGTPLESSAIRQVGRPASKGALEYARSLWPKVRASELEFTGAAGEYRHRETDGLYRRIPHDPLLAEHPEQSSVALFVLDLEPPASLIFYEYVVEEAPESVSERGREREQQAQRRLDELRRQPQSALLLGDERGDPLVSAPR
jgi:hypothetical protein